MKKSSALLIVAALMLTACGAMTQIASTDSGQRFQDGIYNNTPAFRAKGEKSESKSETQALIAKTKESPIYLFGDKKDTVMIPNDMSATIRYDQQLGGTVVTVGENPYDWRYDLENNYGYYYGPYSLSDAWYWNRFSTHWTSPFHWNYYRWYDPYYYGSWYNTCYFGGWYSPWHYYAGWYDPFWYGGWYGWYDPWYYGSHWHHHHHHGWYDPYWDHYPGHGRPDNRKDVYNGPRHLTGSDRVFTSGASLRGGAGRSSSVSRNSTVASSASTKADRVTSNRTSVVRTTPAARDNINVPTRINGGAASATRPGAAIGTGTTTRRPAATIAGGQAVTRQPGTVSRTSTPSNHRRPAATISGSINRGEFQKGSSSGTGRATSATRPSSGYERNSSSYNRSSSSYDRSSSSYNRSSSSSSSRSSISSGSSTSRSSSGGGFSRGGSSSGARR